MLGDGDAQPPGATLIECCSIGFFSFVAATTVLATRTRCVFSSRVRSRGDARGTMILSKPDERIVKTYMPYDR